jgi:hypothetical protein
MFQRTLPLEMKQFFNFEPGSGYVIPIWIQTQQLNKQALNLSNNLHDYSRKETYGQAPLHKTE